MQPSDRRQHLRHRVFRIEVKVATPDAFRASYLRDVSSGGIFVRSQKPLPVGTPVVIELAVASGAPLHMPGAVARIEPTGFGVKFDDLSAEQQQALDELIALSRAEEAADNENDPSVLKERLAEARGSIEAYEQALAVAREAESEALQRAETAEFERGLLAETAREVTTRLTAVENERQRLDGLLAETQRRMVALEKARSLTTATPAPAKEEMNKKLQELEQEIARLREQLSPEGIESMRSELKTLTAQLDDEKLKNMALQRALTRFSSMGGKT